MNSKELFLKDKELSGQLAPVINADWFRKAMIYVRSSFLESNPSAEMLAGARQFENTLLTFTDLNPIPTEPIKSALIHDIDQPRSELKHE